MKIWHPLNLNAHQSPEKLADLRRAFFGIAGNVKSGNEGDRSSRPYKSTAKAMILRRMDILLAGFVEQHRMKLPGGVVPINLVTRSSAIGMVHLLIIDALNPDPPYSLTASGSSCLTVCEHSVNQLLNHTRPTHAGCCF